MHNIYHMTSFSRSGETLMLRCLGGHPDIHIVHQIKNVDTKPDFKLFRHLQNFRDTQISPDDPYVKDVNPKENACLLVKNAVWCHQAPYEGFALVRNPFSIYNSFKIENEPAEGLLHRKAQMYRWSLGIDPNITPGLSYSSNLESLCALYNRKMYDVVQSGVKIIHYENFVANPEKYLRIILNEINVDWHDGVLSSHEKYEEGEVGHGGIKLWKPIHQGSKDSYKKLKPADFSRIYGLTYPVMSMLGYSFDSDGNLNISEA
ncbi:hypothetical protein ACXGSL_10890 [Vreelandella aquamarina]